MALLLALSIVSTKLTTLAKCDRKFYQEYLFNFRMRLHNRQLKKDCDGLIADMLACYGGIAV